MDYIFEVDDKTGRKIHLTTERLNHIRKKHPEVEDSESIEETIRNPDKIKEDIIDETVHYYYKYFKHRKLSTRYLLVAVKYLNGEGYVITAYFERHIK